MSAGFYSRRGLSYIFETLIGRDSKSQASVQVFLKVEITFLEPIQKSFSPFAKTCSDFESIELVVLSTSSRELSSTQLGSGAAALAFRMKTSCSKALCCSQRDMLKR